MLQHTLYHSLLRVSALSSALLLVFVSGVLDDTTATLTQQTENYLANAIGVSVGVAPTELNQMTAALTEREQELIAREAALEEREIAVSLNTGEGRSGERNDLSTYILSTILFILLVLIILNYVLDYLRVTKPYPYEQTPAHR